MNGVLESYTLADLVGKPKDAEDNRVTSYK